MQWKPYDIIILILTATISIVLIMIFIEVLLRSTPMSEGASKIVGGILGSIISLISMYIGAMIQKRKDKN